MNHNHYVACCYNHYIIYFIEEYICYLHWSPYLSSFLDDTYEAQLLLDPEEGYTYGDSESYLHAAHTVANWFSENEE